ncbi:Rid family hydrolase [Saccharopolyspora sp. NFXS83]|uniref:Rid family hydrolase n=1 Tax=Saccharopolyspora sp. NFXS83 TaxID=2993560 RepID=UPI00224ABCBB|nr:Rid family hydrolase [Saccharopolyspora sp. NFXS83]MCX2731961.1 Rid family hydrolase [Saccharopolyspora sp. NFXS83]
MIAGHEARADDGTIAHAGDVRAQLRLTFQRIRETLDGAGFALADVVQLRIHAVDIEAVTANYDVITMILPEASCRPASVLVQVAALSDPAMLVEVEGVAVR